MAGDEPRPGPVRERVLACDRASRILSRAEAELRRAHLPEAARQRAVRAIEQLQGVCAAYGPPRTDGKGGA